MLKQTRKEGSMQISESVHADQELTGRLVCMKAILRERG